MEFGRFVNQKLITQKNKRLLGAAILAGLAGLSAGLCIEGPYKKDSAKVPAAPTVPSEPVTVTPFNFKPSLSDFDVEQPHPIPLIYKRMSHPSFGTYAVSEYAIVTTCFPESDGYQFTNVDAEGNILQGIGAMTHTGGFSPSSPVIKSDLYINPNKGEGVYAGHIILACQKGIETLGTQRIAFLIEFK